MKWEKINATIPDTVDPEEITLAQAIHLIDERAEKAGKKKPSAKKKAPAKKPAAKKKAPAKKPAAKKTAAKKPAAKKSEE